MAASTVGVKENPRRAGAMHRPGGRLELTPVERARELAQLELERPGVVLDGPRGEWRTAVQVQQQVRGKISAFVHGDVETALDYLCIRGLAVARVHDDGLVTPRNPQSYRWTRGATADRLAALASPNDRRKRAGACPSCGAIPPDGTKYCNRDCAVLGGRARRER